ncbi:MAG: S41 family peptidase [Bacteroidales bacterium]
MNNKHKSRIPASVYMPVIMALVLALGFFLGLNLHQPESSPSEGRFFSIGSERYNKINDVLNYINDSYVDSISRTDLEDETIQSIMKSLDPHSAYIPESDFQRMNDPLMGSFEGIGVEFNMIKDTVVVIHPIPGGPSEQAGIMPGDRIVMVEDTVIAGVEKSTDDIVSMLMGEKGTRVDIAVYRPGAPELIEFSLTRDEIPSYSLDIAYMADETTGFIRLNKFSATTYTEFKQALSGLLEEGMEKMILDLRGNGGGFMEAAIQITDELLEPQQLIVYTEGKERPRTTARARRNGQFETQPLVVLIDEWSASASEIIAGAIQDNDRGLVIGRRSFGKGLVQEQVQLRDGSALRLTVAHYYTPTGRSIQRPYDEGEEAYYDEFIERFQSGELASPDSIHFNDSLRFETPAGRVVYGGGGIMPDIFVPLDGDSERSFYNRVMNLGYIYLFAFDYADRHRESLGEYGDAENYVDRFSLSTNTYNEFMGYLREQGLEVPSSVSSISKELIRTNLKAYIGRNMFGAEAFYPVLHSVDRTFEKAMETLRDEEVMAQLRDQ